MIKYNTPTTPVMMVTTHQANRGTKVNTYGMNIGYLIKQIKEF